jgi:hypothetical protein
MISSIAFNCDLNSITSCTVHLDRVQASWIRSNVSITWKSNIHTWCTNYTSRIITSNSLFHFFVLASVHAMPSPFLWKLTWLTFSLGGFHQCHCHPWVNLYHLPFLFIFYLHIKQLIFYHNILATLLVCFILQKLWYFLYA